MTNEQLDYAVSWGFLMQGQPGSPICGRVFCGQRVDRESFRMGEYLSEAVDLLRAGRATVKGKKIMSLVAPCYALITPCACRPCFVRQRRASREPTLGAWLKKQGLHS